MSPCHGLQSFVVCLTFEPLTSKFYIGLVLVGDGTPTSRPKTEVGMSSSLTLSSPNPSTQAHTKAGHLTQISHTDTATQTLNHGERERPKN